MAFRWSVACQEMSTTKRRTGLPALWKDGWTMTSEIPSVQSRCSFLPFVYMFIHLRRGDHCEYGKVQPHKIMFDSAIFPTRRGGLVVHRPVLNSLALTDRAPGDRWMGLEKWSCFLERLPLQTVIIVYKFIKVYKSRYFYKLGAVLDRHHCCSEPELSMIYIRIFLTAFHGATAS